MASYIIVCSEVRSTIGGDQPSGVLEYPGVNSISISSSASPFASKNIEKLQTNINGYELSDYKYPLNRGIQGFRRHWLRGCKHIGASARSAPFPILFPIMSGKITFAQFVEFLQKY